ncbi:N-acetyltransferase [Rhodobacteraceae bacterium CCMM004]|nr:N-acetyltransferase [Rhodobacteraceae bacterium CCMM004]
MRAARPEECAALTDLCLRSKAHCGYDAAFMDACRAELAVTPAILAAGPVQVIEAEGRPVAMAQVVVTGRRAGLHKMFVDPAHMGRGHGRALVDWARATARAAGAVEMDIEADPCAAPFYERMGARVVGDVPSGSIPGRRLPLLVLDLRDG